MKRRRTIPVRPLRTARLSLESLEARLPLGDALLGFLLGPSLLGPALAVLDPGASGAAPAAPRAEPAGRSQNAPPFDPAADPTGAGALSDAFLSLPRNPAAAIQAPGASESLGHAPGDALPPWPFPAAAATTSAPIAGAAGQTTGVAEAGLPASAGVQATDAGPGLTPSPPLSGGASGSPSQALREALAAPPARPAARPGAGPVPVTPARAQESYGNLPLSFEANVGQADAPVQ